MNHKISQREARRWRKRALTAENVLSKQKWKWADSWPEGTIVTSAVLAPDVTSSVKTARVLKHAVVATVADDGRILFWGLPL